MTDAENIINSISDALITIDHKGLIDSFNKAAESIFHYSAAEVIGKNISLLMPNPHRDQHDGYLSKYRDTGVATILGLGRIELSAVRKNGEIFPIYLSVNKLEGEEQRFVGIIQDLSYHQKLESLASLTASLSSDILIRVDTQFKITYINKISKNQSRSNVIGRDIFDFSANGFEYRKSREHLEKVISERKETSFTTETVQDGKNLYFESRVSPIIINDKVSGLIITSSNVSGLKENEKALATIISHIPDGLAVLDLTGRIIEANPAYCKLLGYKKQDVLDTPILKYMHSEHVNDLNQFQKQIEVNGKIRMESQLMNKDGRAFPIDVHGVSIRFSGISGYLLIIRDITESKRAEKDLILARQVLQDFINAAPSSIGIYNQDLDLIEINNAGLQWWPDSTKDSLIGSNITSLSAGIEETKLYEQLKHVIKNGKPFIDQQHIPSAQFGELVMELDSFKVGEGLGIITTNITDKVRAINELRRTKEILEQTGRLARVGGWELNVGTEELYWSDMTKTIHEVESDYTPNLESAINFHKEGISREQISEAIKQAKETGLSQELELEIITARGAERWLKTIVRTELEKGKCIRLFGTLQDITEQKIAEKKLKDAIEQAEDSARAKDNFLAKMSHEIRTPMNAIMGFTQLAQSASGPEQLEEYLADVIKSGQNLLKLIEDLLDVVRTSTHKIVLEPSVFNVNELTSNAIRIADLEAKKKGLKITQDLNIELLILADPARLLQVLLNLLNNAIKFTSEGMIHVAARQTKNESAGPDDLVFSIFDTGIGIAENAQQDIFKPFTQIIPDNKTNDGVGIGLSLSQKLLEYMGGSIGVRTPANKDFKTEFWFTIPCTVPESGVKASPEKWKRAVPSQKLAGENTKPILLVEDNPDNIKLMQIRLKKMGYSVVVAETKAQAIQEFESHSFSLILMDMMLPDGTGLEVYETIKDKCKTPVVPLTADASPKTISKWYAQGIDDFLTKPIDVNELEIVLKKFL